MHNHDGNNHPSNDYDDDDDDPDLEKSVGGIDPMMLKVPTTTKLLKLKTEERLVYYNKYRLLGQFYALEATPMRGKPSVCRACSSALTKGEVRLRHIVCTSKCGVQDPAKGRDKQPSLDACGRYHIRCFLNMQAEKLEMFTHTNPEFVAVKSTRQLAGFDELLPYQQQFVIDTLPQRKRCLGPDRLAELLKIKATSPDSTTKRIKTSNSPSPKKSSVEEKTAE